MNLSAVYPIYKIYDFVRGFLNNWMRHRLIKQNSLSWYEEKPANSLYRDILAIDLYHTMRSSNSWLRIPVFPAGGAVDYKLLYILARLLVEYSFGSVIEFGAGESTKVLSAFANYSNSNVFTIEHDEFWAERVGRGVSAFSHRICHCPLKSFQHSQFGTFNWYNLSEALIPKELKFELFLVDGPIGTARFSRIGIIEHFSEMCASDWVVIWDDLQRLGDLEAFAAFIKSLKQKNTDFGHVIINGQKVVGVIYSMKFRGVAHYF